MHKENQYKILAVVVVRRNFFYEEKKTPRRLIFMHTHITNLYSTLSRLIFLFFFFLDVVFCLFRTINQTTSIDFSERERKRISRKTPINNSISLSPSVFFSLKASCFVFASSFIFNQKT